MKASFIEAMGLSVLLAFGAIGCRTGKPGFHSETMRPDQVHDFAVLYKSNCSACHGDNGLNGAALPLDNPVYLAWAGHDRMVGIVTNGVPHHLMPAFGQSGGGLLTNQQVEDIVNGMISHWGKPGMLNAANAPSYTSTSNGNAQMGKAAFQIYCTRCHGADGRGASSGNSKATNSVADSIVDPTYLSLISTQGLRDIIVSGLPGGNMPDWRSDVPDKPMTDKDVTDIVAWLVSNRVQFPGQPFPSRQPSTKPAGVQQGRE